MASWKDNKVVGIVAGAIVVITFSVVVFGIVKNTTKFKKGHTGKILPAGPMDVEKR